jgi:hypothetical protein
MAIVIHSYDQEIKIRRIQDLFAQERSEDREAQKPGNFFKPRCCKKTRAGDPGFQAQLVSKLRINEFKNH